MTFALTNDPSQSEISGAINYLLANFGANITADPDTGIITGPTGVIIAYLYKYLAVKYADTRDGTVNFSDSPTNRAYYGLRNSNSNVESTNPTDYVWYRVVGGFGTTKFLYYQTSGGRQIEFYVGTASPSIGFVLVPSDPIDLDIITAPSVTSNNFATSFQPSSLQVPRTGDPLTPNFTGIAPKLYGTNNGTAIDFVTAQTDSDALFLPNTWRIGGSSTTGNASISYVNITIGNPTDGGTYALWPAPTAMSASPAYITVPVRFKNSAGIVSQGTPAQIQLVFVDVGTNGSQYAIAYLYQWSTTTPGDPNGTSTYTWATASNGSYTGTNGWYTTVPANPNVPLIELWIASKGVTAPAGTASTTVSWTSGFNKFASSQNGADGVQKATAIVYQWSVSIPTIVGSSTYTWATGGISPLPSGWDSTISESPSPNMTCWAASVDIVDAISATTTLVNWSTASILPFGYVGGTGAYVRLAYSAASVTLNTTPRTITTTGSTTFPANGSWGTGTIWTETVPVLSAGQSIWQSEGVYNPVTGNTIWGAPYLSALKVGNLSAISTNTGNLTVSGTFKAGSAKYTSSTFTGTGAVIYSTGVFAVGNPTKNMVWDGSALTIKGDIIGTSNITITGDSTFSGDNPTSTPIFVYDGSYNIDYSTFGNGTTTATFGNARTGVLGKATSTGSLWNAGVVGYGEKPSGVLGGVGIGVVGSSDGFGGYFTGYTPSSIGLACTTLSPTYTAFQIIQGKFVWGAYTINQPTGLTTTYLRNDGTWSTIALASDSNSLGTFAASSWARIFPTNSGTANAGGSGLNILGSGSTGIVGAYVGTSGSGNTVTIEVQTTSPSDIRLKEEIADSDLGLAFVKQLRPVSYKLIADPKHQKGYGFIADEVDQIIELGSSLVYHEPNWKVGDETGFKTIHYPSYVAVLTKAIQELSLEVEALKAQLRT